jgi:hypothetical protein
MALEREHRKKENELSPAREFTIRIPIEFVRIDPKECRMVIGRTIAKSKDEKCNKEQACPAKRWEA